MWKRNPTGNVIIPSLAALAVLVTRYATGVVLRYVQQTVIRLAKEHCGGQLQGRGKRSLQQDKRILITPHTNR